MRDVSDEHLKNSKLTSEFKENTSPAVRSIQINHDISNKLFEITNSNNFLLIGTIVTLTMNMGIRARE